MECGIVAHLAGQLGAGARQAEAFERRAIAGRHDRLEGEAPQFVAPRGPFGRGFGVEGPERPGEPAIDEVDLKVHRRRDDDIHPGAPAVEDCGVQFRCVAFGVGHPHAGVRGFEPGDRAGDRRVSVALRTPTCRVRAPAARPAATASARITPPPPEPARRSTDRCPRPAGPAPSARRVRPARGRCGPAARSRHGAGRCPTDCASLRAG